MSDWIGMAATPRPPRPELKERVLRRALAARPWSRWALAAAATLALAMTGSGLLWRRVVRVGRDLAATRDTLDLLRSPGARVLVIPVTVADRPGALTMVVDSASHRWLVVCHNLAPNAPGQTYQLWFVTDRGMRPAALMPMEHDRPMLMALKLPADSAQVMGAAMSIEPREGSAEPTGPMVFHVDL